MEIAVTVIGVVAGIYTIASRVIPTSKTWCIIGLAINALKGISDALDKRRNNKPIS